MGDFLDNKKRTLIELVVKNFVEVKKKINVNRRKTRNRISQNYKSPISIVLINSAIKQITSEDKERISEKEDLEETTEDGSEDKNKIIINGGYGTVSKNYSMTPTVKYVNYDKLWGHVGTFRSQSMYENLAGGFSSQSESKSTGILVDNKVIEKAERHFKYFVSGEVIGDIGLVPPVGTNIDSRDWEKYRIMTQMSIYRPLLALYRAIV